MGRKSTYFRHSLSAHRDEKIESLIEAGGLELYGFYFLLLEHYGAKLIDDDERKITQAITLRSLSVSSGFRKDKCKKTLQRIADLGLIDLVLCKSTVSSAQVGVPNFMKYFGKYKKAEDMDVCNKSKAKQRKGKESKSSLSSNDDSINHKFNKIKESWNMLAGYHKSIPAINSLSAKRKKLLTIALKEIPDLEDWYNLISEVQMNPFNVGENERGWSANFDWLIRPEKQNYLILHDKYKNQMKKEEGASGLD